MDKKEKVIQMLKNNEIHCGLSAMALLYTIQFELQTNLKYYQIKGKDKKII